MSNSTYSRKWKVHVIQSVHGMLGWARSYDQAQSYFDAEMRNNLDLMDQTDHYRKEEQHRFTVDSTWIISEYLKRWPTEADRVRRRIQDGRLEVSAYEASSIDLCFSGEELIRCFFSRTNLERKGYGHGNMVVHTDIHAFSFGLPSLAAGSGIKYIMVGTNTDSQCGFSRYPNADVIPRGHALFWWEGIDGRRILCFHYGSYFEASDAWNGGEFDPTLVEDYLRGFEEKGDAYPCDAVIMFGTGGDGIRDRGFHHSLIGTNRIRDWNREHDAYNMNNFDAPLLINGCLQEFFQYVEARFGSHIPVFAGGWGGGDWLWDTQSQRFAKTGLQSRQSSARIRVAETLSAASTALWGARYPKETIDQVFKYRIWHDEHDTNGTRPLVSQDVKEQWRAIQQCWGARRMERPSMETLIDSLGTFGAHVPTGAGTKLMVFNPLSRTRSDVVRWPCAAPGAEQTWQITDGATGETIPSQYIRENDTGCLLFVARNVPSLGYKVYTVGDSVPTPPQMVWSTNSGGLENKFYRVTCNHSGAIQSIWDKSTNRQIVRPGTQFNLYVNDGTIVTASDVFVENVGPVGGNLWVQVSGLPLNTQSLSTRIWLYADLDHIDITNEFAISDAEQEIYYDFSMDLEGPLTFTLEGPSTTILTAGRDEFDEARLAHWNTFSFIDVSSPDYGITLFSPDARQAYLGGRLTGNTRPRSDLTNPEILIRVMGHGPFEQDWLDPNGGPVDNPYRYRFSLTTHRGQVDVSRAVGGGWAALFPLQVCRIESHQRGVLVPHQASLWRLPAPLMVSAFKKAEMGTYKEYILRLWNATSIAVTGAYVGSDLFFVDRARENDHVERDIGPDLPIHDGTFTVDVGGRAMVTVRVWLTPKELAG